MDLAAWRAEGLVELLRRFIERDPEALQFHDQDAINAVLHQRIRILDQRWNVQTAMFRTGQRSFPQRFEEIRTACRDPAIIHYAGSDKPWRFRAETACKNAYFRYLAKTEWRDARPATAHLGQTLEYRLGRWLDRTGLDYVHLMRRLRRAPSRLCQMAIAARP
jgi:lipopolysaccharide biosynthesis glycosyltransferase